MRCMQALQTEYAEKYLEGLGVSPSSQALALVHQHCPLNANSIEIRTQQLGNKVDEAVITPQAPVINKALLGGRNPAAARDMVRLGAASALSYAEAGSKSTGTEVSSERPAPENAMRARKRPSSGGGGKADECEQQGVFAEAVRHYVFPYTLKHTMRDLEVQRRAIDLAAVRCGAEHMLHDCNSEGHRCDQVQCLCIAGKQSHFGDALLGHGPGLRSTRVQGVLGSLQLAAMVKNCVAAHHRPRCSDREYISHHVQGHSVT